MTLFSAPNYCGDYDNAGGMMSVDDKLMCSFQVTLWCALYRDTHCSTSHIRNYLSYSSFISTYSLLSNSLIFYSLLSTP